jgi:hypothetical protein
MKFSRSRVFPRVLINAHCVLPLVIGTLLLMFEILALGAGPQHQALANPSPELVGKLTDSLNITQSQAVGGAGALFGLAKSKLKAEDFSKVAAVVPGMDDLLGAAPKPASDSPISSLSAALPSGAGSLASLASSFQSLGLSPEMASKFVPVLTQFVKSKGGASLASLLGGALR